MWNKSPCSVWKNLCVQIKDLKKNKGQRKINSKNWRRRSFSLSLLLALALFLLFVGGALQRSKRRGKR